VEELCCPDIRGNFIESNRKAGIKLADMATAYITGYNFSISNKLDIDKSDDL
jgi:hypothetical protein